MNEILLNKRQQGILNFIKEFVADNGYPPSVREIGAAVGLKSSSTVHSHLARLEECGCIRRNPATPRAIEIFSSAKTDEPEQKRVTVPLVGTVTAGTPILAVENIEEVYSLPQDLIGTDEETFMLRVQGESMINAGIFDDDYVFVKKQSTARNRDIVVALINGESTTVKRFFKEADCIRLQPENDSMQPIYEQDVSILGKVIGVYRRM